MKNNEKQNDKLVHNSTHKKAAMISALEKGLGIVTTAAKIVGIERSTHYFWMESDPEYREAVKALDNVVLDFAESKLHKLVEELNPTAVIFLLKTKGRSRGYIENEVNINAINILIEKLEKTDLE